MLFRDPCVILFYSLLSKTCLNFIGYGQVSYKILLIQAPWRGWGWEALAPPLFWLIKLLFQFFSKVLHKKVHRVILCQTCGPQRKHCFFLIAPFRSNIVFWRFSWCLSRQFAEFLVRSRRLDFRLSVEFSLEVSQYIYFMIFC